MILLKSLWELLLEVDAVTVASGGCSPSVHRRSVHHLLGLNWIKQLDRSAVRGARHCGWNAHRSELARNRMVGALKRGRSGDHGRQDGRAEDGNSHSDDGQMRMTSRRFGRT